MIMKTSITILLLLVMFASFAIDATKDVKKNAGIGWKFISFHSDGTLSTRECCDEKNKTAGHCSPDQCDTSFEVCASRKISQKCDVLPPQMTPTTYNNNSIHFGKRFGNGSNTTTTLIVTRIPYNKQNINVTFRALEMNEPGEPNTKDEIATFSLIIDWHDPFFNKTPRFKRFVLNDTNARLVIDVFSMCSNYFYTDNCSVYCHPRNTTHFTCNSNGTKQCYTGWNGTECDKKIDSCTDNKCLNGSTCVPTPIDNNNYTCTCPVGFTGSLCETQLPTSTSPTSLTGQTTSTPTTIYSAMKTSFQTTSTVSNSNNRKDPISEMSKITSQLQVPNTNPTTHTKFNTVKSTNAHEDAGGGGAPTNDVTHSDGVTQRDGVTNRDRGTHRDGGTRIDNDNRGTHRNDGEGGSDKNDGDKGEDKDDGNDRTAGLAAGVSVGVMCLLLIIGAGGYFIYKKNQRVQVTPKEKHPSAKDKLVAESAKNDEPRQSTSITLNQTVGDVQAQHQSGLPNSRHPPVDTGITV